MSRLAAAAALSLLTSAAASAQVLDDDLEFENHVATVELGKDSPVLEGVGLSREITYEAHFEGTLFLECAPTGQARRRFASRQAGLRVYRWWSPPASHRADWCVIGRLDLPMLGSVLGQCQ